MAAAADDRAADLRALDATFSGVHGLAASGITRLPPIFRAAVPDAAGQVQEPPPAAIPVIDLSGGRAATVAAVGRAAAEWGFFQVTAHGVPPDVASAAVRAARAFHETPGGEGSEKARLYSRDPAMAVKYNCNFDLHQSKLANWRDTLYLRMAPNPPPPADMPDSCRHAWLTAKLWWTNSEPTTPASWRSTTSSATPTMRSRRSRGSTKPWPASWPGRSRSRRRLHLDRSRNFIKNMLIHPLPKL